MRRKTMRTLVAGGAFLALAATAAPESPRATPLATSEAERFVGSWVLKFNALGNERELGLTVADVNGFLGATLDSADQPEPRALDSIVKLANGVDFQFEMPFGSQRLTMHLELVESAGRITGVLREENNIFQTQVTGVRGELVVDESKRTGRTESRVIVAGDKQIKVTFGNLSIDGEDYPRLNDVPEGAVYRFVGSRATKLFTDTNLQFGDTLVKTENVAPNYPGVYSLWLKRTATGWALVINSQPDIWGTQHDPSSDVAEIPLTTEPLNELQKEFLITLQSDGGAGNLRIAWGDTAWSVPFSVAQ